MENKTQVNSANRPTILLRVEVTHNDKILAFERPAPQLPHGMSWQKGFWFSSGNGCDSLKVDEVYILVDGSVEVLFEERYYSDASDEAIKDFTDLGWSYINQP